MLNLTTPLSGKKDDANGGTRPDKGTIDERIRLMRERIERGEELFTKEGLNMAGTTESIVGPQKVGVNDAEHATDESGGDTHPLDGCFRLGALNGVNEEGKVLTGAWTG